MKHLLLAAIRIYQRHISSYKGFCCAYRAHTGRASCSMLGYRAVRGLGAWRGLAVLRLRLHKCGVAHRRYGQASATLGVAEAWRRPAGTRNQAGFCDPGCDLPCDLASPDGDAVCNCLSNCPAGDCGDWGSSEKKKTSKKNKRKEEDQVYLPPDYRPGRGHGN